MTDALTEIADALDIMVSDGTDELAGHNASFWRDAALVLRGFGEELVEEETPVKEDQDRRKGSGLDR